MKRPRNKRSEGKKRWNSALEFQLICISVQRVQFQCQFYIPICSGSAPFSPAVPILLTASLIMLKVVLVYMTSNMAILHRLITRCTLYIRRGRSTVLKQPLTRNFLQDIWYIVWNSTQKEGGQLFKFNNVRTQRHFVFFYFSLFIGLITIIPILISIHQSQIYPV